MQLFQSHSNSARMRKFLGTTKGDVVMIEVKSRICTISALVGTLVDIGLKYEEQDLKHRINAPILHRPPAPETRIPVALT
ncbi:hypothetical protein ACFLWG_04920 [Chloroflexota bacterium]